MRKTIDKITEPAPSASGRHSTANENRPARSPTARELIAEASAARSAMDAAGDEPPAAQQPGEGEADDRAPAGGPLPTMEELELARDDHSRKIAERRAFPESSRR